jgi:DNA-binding response OmpR family regulator
MPRVIVVTDDVWVDNEVRAALSDAGTELIFVSEPKGAVAAAAEHAPDAAVVDLQVGSMGGMAVVRALRSAMAAGEVKALRTVLLLDRRVDDFLARRAGADRSVVKPFTAQELRAALALPAQV